MLLVYPVRFRLMDVRREITIIGQHNHDTEQTINRLETYVLDVCRRMNVLNELKEVVF